MSPTRQVAGTTDKSTATPFETRIHHVFSINYGFLGQRKKVVVTNVRPGTHAVIQSEGIGPNGRYEWRVHLVVDLSFYDTEQQYRQAWNVDLRILRVRAMSIRYGIGIHELLAESASE